MAAAGFTPISLYYSTTAAAVPTAGNLVPGELAINITDGKLYYENNAGVVTLFGSTGDVSTISFGTTGLTPSTATGGAITVSGTLVTSNGGTGLNSFATGDLMYYSSGTAMSKLTIGTNGQILQSNGTAPTWVAASSVVGGAAGSNTQVQYNNSGALAGSSNLTFDGTTLTAAGLSGPLNGTVGATTPSTVVATQVNVTAEGPVRFEDNTGGQYVGLKAPATVSSNVTFTLPGADGSNGQAIVTDGSGNLSFGTAGISTGKAIAMAIVFGF